MNFHDFDLIKKCKNVQITNLSSILSNEISRFDKINDMKPIGNAKVCAVGERVCFSIVHPRKYGQFGPDIRIKGHVETVWSLTT